eukprot:TRINITY_DN14384_c2_g1_i1.p1 TRINITY_DN14384_c2_g1~~TRINITY_DN14384_c2_g1_i1.p1  ORF type:complete len:595 (+),score=136.84 TRINITY_DN14384_c2_g1_i1:72-1856(+)
MTGRDGSAAPARELYNALASRAGGGADPATSETSATDSDDADISRRHPGRAVQLVSLALLGVGLTAAVSLLWQPVRHAAEDLVGGAPSQDMAEMVGAAAPDAEAFRNASDQEEGCRDMRPNDRNMCMREIQLAKQRLPMSEGHVLYLTERYPGLVIPQRHSELAMWQAYAYRVTHGKCPRPCNMAQSRFCAEKPVPKLWNPATPSESLPVKILSYNLFWWNLFGQRKGTVNRVKNAPGKLIKKFMNPPFDVMGFQECEDPQLLLEPVGLYDTYEVFKGTHAICMAYKKETWELLERGQEDVAEDQHTEYYGTRGTQWMRLRHAKTNATLLFLNHHGPLSVNSGGQCGGRSTALNLLHLVANRGKEGDLVVLVGDFNANAASYTIQELWKHMVLLYNGDSFGGVDNIFSNADKATVVNASNIGMGGSDHKAVLTALVLEPAGVSGNAPKPGGNLRASDLSFEDIMNAATRSGEGSLAATQEEPAKSIEDAIDSQCGLLEPSTEYTTSPFLRWSENYDAIVDPRTCCGLCAKDARCKAWVLYEWVESISGPRCVLKGGHVVERTARRGVVSGLPPLEGQRVARESAGAAISSLALR